MASYLRQAAMRPVMIESAVSGLLESTVALGRMHDKQQGVTLAQKRDTQGKLGYLEEAQVDLLLDAPADVQKAGVKRLRQMLSEGELVYAWHTFLIGRSGSHMIREILV